MYNRLDVCDMSDSELMAEITDEEINDLQKKRYSQSERVKNLQDQLARAEDELFDTETAIKEWCRDTRQSLRDDG